MKKVCQLCVPPRLVEASLFEAHRQAHRNAENRAVHDARYGPEHRRLRARWAPLVEKGIVVCWRCDRLIEGADIESWQLGHSDEDPSVWMGPEHAACNQATATHRRDRG